MFKRIDDDMTVTPEYRENQKTMLRQVMQYCQNNVECRRTQVLLHFGERFDPLACNQGCDNCCNSKDSTKIDMSEVAIAAIQCLKRLGPRQTLTKAKLVQKREEWGSTIPGNQEKGLSMTDRERLLNSLLSLGILEQVSCGNASNGFPQYKINVSDLLSKRVQC